MRYFLYTVLIFALAGCATPRGDTDLAAFEADYCNSAGSRQTTSNTNVTVQYWDDEATTAGHRGVLVDEKMQPDMATLRGC